MAETTYMNKRQEERIKQEEEEIAQLEKERSADQETNQGESEENTEGDEPKTSEEKTWKKRHGDLRRHSQQKEQELKDRIDELEKRLDKKPSAVEAPAPDEDIEAWSKKYPDISRIVKTLAQKIADEKLEGVKTELSSFKQEKETMSKEKGMAAIREAHPDFDELQEDDAFHDWLEDQAQVVQDALYSNTNDPKGAIAVLDMYKAKANIKTNKKNAEKDAVSGVNTKGKTTVDEKDEKGYIRESEIDAMSAQEYEKRETEIMEARKAGRLIYDLSGAVQ